MIWPIIYVAAVLVANYTAIWFIPFPLFGLVAVGTLVFGVTFTARDYAHKLGRPKVYVMLVVAIVASTVLSLTAPVDWRIVLASAVAIGLSETTDTEIYQRLIHRSWLHRVSVSNAVSVPLDTILFNTLAFAGVFAFPMLVSIIFGEMVVKYTVGGMVALWRFLS